jgi:hypothetical protein
MILKEAPTLPLEPYLAARLGRAGARRSPLC